LRKVAFPVFAQNDAPSRNLERDQEKLEPGFPPGSRDQRKNRERPRRWDGFDSVETALGQRASNGTRTVALIFKTDELAMNGPMGYSIGPESGNRFSGQSEARHRAKPRFRF
jgi:hypothetical protein